MTQEVAGGPVEEQRTSPVPGGQSPALDDMQQRTCVDVAEPAPPAPSVWPGVRMGDGEPEIGP